MVFETSRNSREPSSHSEWNFGKIFETGNDVMLKRKKMAGGGLALALALTSGFAHGAEWVVDPNGGGDFTTLSAAISNPGLNDGDTIHVAAGMTSEPSSISINHSVTIVGEGSGVSTIGGPSSGVTNFFQFILVAAPDVTFQDLTITLGNGVDGSLGAGYTLSTNQPRTTIRGVEFYGDYARSAVLMQSGSSEVTVEDSLFTGFWYRGAVRGSAPNVQINRNAFLEHHYMWGPLYLDTGNPLSGVISYNYFLNRVGTPIDIDEDGNYTWGDTGFRSNGQDQTTLALFNSNVVGEGLEIFHNTLVFQDQDLQNAAEAFPLPRAINYGQSVANLAEDMVIIRDNIFSGYMNDQTIDENDGYFWDVEDGVIGTSLVLTGEGAHATFQSADFDIGARGTLNIWIKMLDTNRRNQLIEGPGDGGIQFQYRENAGGQWYGRPFTPTLNDYSIMDGGAGAFQGDWKNLQFTWDVDTQEMRIYINGVETGYLLGPDIPEWNMGNVTNTVNGLMYFGFDPGIPERRLHAKVDDFAIYSSVLSQADRDEIRNNGAAPHADLIAHWPFNETEGTIVPSASGTDIPMTIQPATETTLYAHGAIIGSEGNGVAILNNLFFENAINAPDVLDESNIVDADPAFVGEGDSPVDQVALHIGPDPAASPAVSTATNGSSIGAWQPGEVFVSGVQVDADPEGDDQNNPGTNAEQPFRTIERGYTGLGPMGGRITLLPGTHMPESLTIAKDIVVGSTGAFTDTLILSHEDEGVTSPTFVVESNLMLTGVGLLVSEPIPVHAGGNVHAELNEIQMLNDGGLFLLEDEDIHVRANNNLIHTNGALVVFADGVGAPDSASQIQFESNWYNDEFSVPHTGGYIPGLAKVVTADGAPIEISDDSVVAQLDRDADGIPDAFELHASSTTSFDMLDTSGDGIPDGADPDEFDLNADSNDSRFVDWYEINSGRDLRFMTPHSLGKVVVNSPSTSVMLSDAIRALQVVNGMDIEHNINALNVVGNVNTPYSLANPLQILRFQATIRQAFPAVTGVQ